MAGTWKTWADVPAQFKNQWQNVPDFEGYSGRRVDMPDMPEPIWDALGTPREAWNEDNKSFQPTNSLGDPSRYGYDAGWDDSYALQRHPDGSFSQIETESGSDFFEQGILPGLAMVAAAFGGGALMGGGGAGAAGMGATGAAEAGGMTAAEAWGAGAGLGGDTLTAMGMGEAGMGAAAGGGLSALAPMSVGSPGAVASVTAGGLGGGMGSSLIPGIANATLGQLGSAALGGLLGGKDGEKTSKTEPWGPAQPYILDNLKSSKKLQDFYQQNPFNQQQKTAYQNTFGDLDNFRQNTAPGLMDFANKAMTSNYQRQRGGAPGSGGGYGGAVQPGGLLQSGQGPFSVNPGQQYGLLDFAAMNPFRGK